MSLAVCSELSPAGGIVTSELPWERLVTFGPSGFAAHARVRFIPDPAHEGQAESDAALDASLEEVEQWRVLLRRLARETSTPSDCSFALWDGWNLPASARRWPTFAVPGGASLPARSFFLFHGALSDVDTWDESAEFGIWGRAEFSRGGPPAFVWPSDHAWCVAADVDPHWAGIGASRPAIDRLIADRQLDAVLADPSRAQPAYRS